ncbi:hypothetical protein VNI00_011097 [Paramarasmius palmivorus]|uniref:Uncharacterized protein n=1 Tax=Paramarasmius palmivorus TaxID=297713 RepID=A0AAW0CBV7_9AGAR
MPPRRNRRAVSPTASDGSPSKKARSSVQTPKRRSQRETKPTPKKLGLDAASDNDSDARSGTLISNWSSSQPDNRNLPSNVTESNKKPIEISSDSDDLGPPATPSPVKAAPKANGKGTAAQSSPRKTVKKPIVELPTKGVKLSPYDSTDDDTSKKPINQAKKTKPVSVSKQRTKTLEVVEDSEGNDDVDDKQGDNDDDNDEDEGIKEDLPSFKKGARPVTPPASKIGGRRVVASTKGSKAKKGKDVKGKGRGYIDEEAVSGTDEAGSETLSDEVIADKDNIRPNSDSDYERDSFVVSDDEDEDKDAYRRTKAAKSDKQPEAHRRTRDEAETDDDSMEVDVLPTKFNAEKRRKVTKDNTTSPTKGAGTKLAKMGLADAVDDEENDDNDDVDGAQEQEEEKDPSAIIAANPAVINGILDVKYQCTYSYEIYNKLALKKVASKVCVMVPARTESTEQVYVATIKYSNIRAGLKSDITKGQFKTCIEFDNFDQFYNPGHVELDTRFRWINNVVHSSPPTAPLNTFIPSVFLFTGLVTHSELCTVYDPTSKYQADFCHKIKARPLSQEYRLLESACGQLLDAKTFHGPIDNNGNLIFQTKKAGWGKRDEMTRSPYDDLEEPEASTSSKRILPDKKSAKGKKGDSNDAFPLYLLHSDEVPVYDGRHKPMNGHSGFSLKAGKLLRLKSLPKLNKEIERYSVVVVGFTLSKFPKLKENFYPSVAFNLLFTVLIADPPSS